MVQSVVSVPVVHDVGSSEVPLMAVSHESAPPHAMVESPQSGSSQSSNVSPSLSMVSSQTYSEVAAPPPPVVVQLADAMQSTSWQSRYPSLSSSKKSLQTVSCWAAPKPPA